MKRLVILSVLVLAVTSIARAQDPCPTCNEIYQQAVSPPTHAREDDNNQYRSLRRPIRLYMSFDASVAVTNDTAKTIKRITWESSLINSATRETIGTYVFVTRQRIHPHQVFTISRKVEVPLDPRVISANQTIRTSRGVPNVIRTEQTGKIKEIEYVDGSIGTP